MVVELSAQEMTATFRSPAFWTAGKDEPTTPWTKEMGARVGGGVKRAVTEVAALTTTTQLMVVQLVPLQLLNIEPPEGLAVKVTAAPRAKDAEQVPEATPAAMTQLIAPSAETTDPLPCPPPSTVKAAVV